MSYTRRVSKTISVHYSGSVSYPASEHGGTQHYSGYTQETVYVNVEVDTDPFDASAKHCRNSVDALTASVAATEAAQVASIKSNSHRVGKTIIDGFFKTIRSDISQQIDELRNNLDAIFVKLQSDAKRCTDMRHQMEVDYNRKKDQYTRIFTELDKELENRIFNLDKPTFDFSRDNDKLYGRLVSSDMVTTAAVSGAENALLDSKLNISHAKERTMKAINSAKRFLQVQKQSEKTIQRNVVNKSHQGNVFLPVCYMETTNANSEIGRQVYCNKKLDSFNNRISEELRQKQWAGNSKEESDSIRRYFNEEVSASLGSDSHSDRVREQILRMINI
ncbi:MAG: hypothetical protein K6D59_04900 [Bacteroidales bacterium]|nr:hypothetical protein [Bacteroidales bacterium]